MPDCSSELSSGVVASSKRTRSRAETYSAEDGDAEIVDHLPQHLGAEERRAVEEDESGASLKTRDEVVCSAKGKISSTRIESDSLMTHCTSSSQW